jgi:hypothetical protein
MNELFDGIFRSLNAATRAENGRISQVPAKNILGRAPEEKARAEMKEVVREAGAHTATIQELLNADAEGSEAVRSLPLDVSQVLEDEYARSQGTARYMRRPWEFQDGDFHDIVRFGQRLREPIDPLSAFLKEKLSAARTLMQATGS